MKPGFATSSDNVFLLIASSAARSHAGVAEPGVFLSPSGDRSKLWEWAAEKVTAFNVREADKTRNIDT